MMSEEKQSMSFHSPGNNPDNGISEHILLIRLAMEAKRWDVMVLRVKEYLEKTADDRKGMRN